MASDKSNLLIYSKGVDCQSGGEIVAHDVLEDVERVEDIIANTGIPPSALSVFKEAVGREKVRLLKGLKTVCNVGEFMVAYGLASVSAGDFIRAAEALFKMTGGQILEIEELSLYKQALEKTIRLLIKMMDYLPMDVRGEIHEEYLKILALWDEPD